RAKVLPFDEILGMPVAAARRERQVNDFVRARLGERLGELDVRMLERFERYHGRLGLVAETGRRREVAMDVEHAARARERERDCKQQLRPRAAARERHRVTRSATLRSGRG